MTASGVSTPARPGISGAQGSPQSKLNVPDPFTRRTTKLPRKRQPTQSSARYQVQKVPPDYQHLTPLKGELLLLLSMDWYGLLHDPQMLPRIKLKRC